MTVVAKAQRLSLTLDCSFGGTVSDQTQYDMNTSGKV